MGALILDGDVGECERILDEIAGMQHGPRCSAATWPSPAPGRSWRWPRATWRRGCGVPRRRVDEMAGIRFPGMETSGLEPWALVAGPPR